MSGDTLGRISGRFLGGGCGAGDARAHIAPVGGAAARFVLEFLSRKASSNTPVGATIRLRGEHQSKVAVEQNTHTLTIVQ